MVKEFSASLSSMRQNIDESRKIRNEIENEVTKNDETSIWSVSESSKNSSFNSVKDLNNSTLQEDQKFETVDTVEDLVENSSPPEPIFSVENSTEIPSGGSFDHVIDQNGLTNDDIEETEVLGDSYQSKSSQNSINEEPQKTSRSSGKSSQPSHTGLLIKIADKKAYDAS